MSAAYFLRLSSQPIIFEPISSATSVFYDKDNQQLFAVRGSGAMGVTMKDRNQSYTFRLEDKGAIQSIKFNPDLSVLAIKRSSNSVEFLNFQPPPASSPTTILKLPNVISLQSDSIEYSQISKSKNSKLYDFNWLNEKEILFVTDQSVEYYQLLAEKRILRQMKTFQFPNTNWQLFSRDIGLLLISHGLQSGNSFTPLSYARNQLFKLPKFEVDLPQSIQQQQQQRSNSITSQQTNLRRIELTERDCALAVLYDKVYLLVIRQVTRVPGQGSLEVVLYQIEEDRPAQKRHILRLNLHGRCALNVIDNLIFLHHQTTKQTYVYDIEEKSTSENDGFQTIHLPILNQLSIQPQIIDRQLLSPSVLSQQTSSPLSSQQNIELYSSNWIVFLPNVIIDVKLGCLWYLTINLDALLDIVKERILLLEILLRRTNGKSSILMLLYTLLTSVIAPVQIDSTLWTGEQTAAGIFDLWLDMIHRINNVYIEITTSTPSLTNRPLLEQTDVFTVLCLFETIVPTSTSTTHSLTINRSSSINSTDDDSLTSTTTTTTTTTTQCLNKKLKFAIAIVLEYIRSLNNFNIPIQHFLYDLLVNLLIKNKHFYQLQQLIQYHVLSDSKSIACLLLSLSSKHQPTTQIALDMLKRLNTANEEILEILLELNLIIPALHFSVEHLPINFQLARKLMDAAIKADELLSNNASNQNILFYTVYTYFDDYFQQQKQGPSSTITSPQSTPTIGNSRNNELDFFTTFFNQQFQPKESDFSNIQ